MNNIQTALILLNLVGGISGLILAWRSYKAQVRETLFEDAMDLAESRKGEIERLEKANERLEAKLTESQKRTLQARYAEQTADQQLADTARLYRQKCQEIHQCRQQLEQLAQLYQQKLGQTKS